MAKRKGRDSNAAEGAAQSKKEDDKDTTQELTKAQQQQLQKLTKAQQQQLQSFIRIEQAVGRLPADLEDLRQLTEADRADLAGKFHAWQQAGSPRPQIKNIEAKTERILAVYRRKQFGRQKIYYKIAGGQQLEGVKVVNEYRQIPSPDDPTTLIDDEGTVISTTLEYTLDYTEKLGRELMERCMREAVNPKFYIVDGGFKYVVTEPSNFTGDWDDILHKARNKQVI